MTTSSGKRLQALDVMRGITIAAMILFNNPGSWKTIYAPLRHADWIGLTPTDLAYPFFMFIMGVAIAFSMRRYLQPTAALQPAAALQPTSALQPNTPIHATPTTSTGTPASDSPAPSSGKHSAIWRILRRTLLLFAVGLILSNFSKLLGGTLSLDNFRIMGVLQRLALAYGIGAMLYLYIPRKGLLPVASGLLVVYVVILQCFNGYVCSAENILAKIDTAILGAGHMITQKGPDGIFAFEPESILGTISSLAQVLLGAWVGRLILEQKDDRERVRRIAVFGTVLLLCGFLGQYLDPICKKIWTSSFTLVTSGAACLLLALLIELIDIRGCTRWTPFFKVFGTNAIYSYTIASVGASVIGKLGVKSFFYSKIFQPLLGDYGGSLAYGLFFILVIFLCTLPLYRKKIFLKL